MKPCLCLRKWHLDLLGAVYYLSQPWPVWSVCRVRVVSRWEMGQTWGQRLRCAAGNTGWGPVPGM